MVLRWSEDKEYIFRSAKGILQADGTYFKRIRDVMVLDGYDEQEIDAVLVCEERITGALKKMVDIYIDEFTRKVSPEEAQANARYYLKEYNQSMEIGFQILDRGESQLPAEGQETGMG